MRLFDYRGRFTLQALGLAQAWRGEGLTLREIGKRLRHSPSNILKHLNEAGKQIEDGRRRPRAPSSSAQRAVVQRRRKVLKVCVSRSSGHHPRQFASTREMARELRRQGLAISASTVRRDLRALGFRAKRRPTAQKLYPMDPATRVLFANSVDVTSDIFFSDEKMFDCNDHSCKTEWCREGVLPSVMQRERWAPKVHVWGMIGIGVKRLVVLPECGITGPVYKRVVLQRHVVPLFEELKAAGRQPVFMQDGARAHTSHANIKYLTSKLVRILLNWPPRSPDLNPIENLWALIQELVSNHGPADKEELTAFVLQVWDAIPQSVVDNYVRSFADRVNECIAKEGRQLSR